MNVVHQPLLFTGGRNQLSTGNPATRVSAGMEGKLPRSFPFGGGKNKMQQYKDMWKDIRVKEERWRNRKQFLHCCNMLSIGHIATYSPRDYLKKNIATTFTNESTNFFNGWKKEHCPTRLHESLRQCQVLAEPPSYGNSDAYWWEDALGRCLSHSGAAWPQTGDCVPEPCPGC